MRDALWRAWWTPQPGALPALMLPLAVLFGIAGAVRRAGFRAGWLRAIDVGVPVIVVGNLIVGGAGKTPTVMAIVQWLLRQGRQPGVISRGYGRSGGRSGEAVRSVAADSPAADVGDEPLLIHRRTGVPTVVGSNRVAAAQALLARHPTVDVIVSDDGLQHRRLARRVEVVVFDARGVGNGALLPSGPLREPMSVLAGTPPPLVLYNAPRPSTPAPGFIARRALAGVVGLAPWHEGAAFEPHALHALHALRGRRVHAAAGIAEPQRFFAMLEAAGLAIEPHLMPDHADFATLPWPADAADAVITEKDAVKIAPGRTGRTAVWVAGLDFEPETAFFTELARRLSA
jgi:tetraacyldisaccharide 4'-kinase